MNEETQTEEVSIEVEKIPFSIELITGDERKRAKAIAEDESKIADRKQHADKMLQKFAKLDTIAPHRAIWELVQNACDLAPKCEVTIDYSDNGFSFSHNGKPFTTSTLISLIKQVSNKGDETKNESESDDIGISDRPVEVGKFGTGFITTHSFGRIFSIDSLLELDSKFIGIENFRIDRSPTTWKPLSQNLLAQEEQVYRLIDTGSAVDLQGAPKTTFRFNPRDVNEFGAIKNSSSHLSDYFPIVLALNKSLTGVTILDDNKEIVYKMGKRTKQDGYFVTEIISDKLIQVYSIVDEQNKIEVILPLTEGHKATTIPINIAKLFLFYPLIGTEQLGINFIIHSEYFYPTEPRDGIYLAEDNTQVKDYEKKNKEIIDIASELIFDFVKTNGPTISDPLHLAKASFTTNTGYKLLDEYYTKLKTKWTLCFNECELVETNDGRISPAKADFFDPEIFVELEYFDAIYTIASAFWDALPKKEIANEWTNIVLDWADNRDLITLVDIAEAVSEKGNVANFDKETLLNFYKCLCKTGHSDLFENYELLPNKYGNFSSKETLVKPNGLYSSLVSIAEVIIPNVPATFVHPDFELEFQFKDYNRALLSKDINAALWSLKKDEKLSDLLKQAVLQICSIFPPATSPSVRRKVTPLIAGYFGFQFVEEIQDVNDSDKFDHEYNPFRTLVREFFNDFSKNAALDQNYIQLHWETLKECLTLLHNYTDVADILNSTNIYPTQDSKLAVHTDLNIEIGFPEVPEDNAYFKELFEKVVGPLRSQLVHGDFANILPRTNKGEKKAIELAGSIEHNLKEEGYEDINKNPYSFDIFKVIEYITNQEVWQKLFSDLDNRKEVIMMSKITEKEVRNDLFSIIRLDKTKISTLGNLSKNPQMNEIIRLGEKALKDAENERRDWSFKKKIGLYIENLVREELAGQIERFHVEVKPEQGGQDMIAWLDDQMGYFVEVKSQWEINEFVSMSYAQSRRSVFEQHRYALCMVDLADYMSGNDARYEPEIEDIIDRISFVTNIGKEVEKLIESAMTADSEQHNVRFSEDYRVKVFNTITTGQGVSFSKFINILISNLRNQYPNAFTN